MTFSSAARGSPHGGMEEGDDQIDPCSGFFLAPRRTRGTQDYTGQKKILEGLDHSVKTK